MIKAVFLDYTGTIIEEGGPDGMEMLKRCYRNSDMESMEAMLAYWWKLIKNFEAVSYKDSYITEDEIVDRHWRSVPGKYISKRILRSCTGFASGFGCMRRHFPIRQSSLKNAGCPSM